MVQYEEGVCATCLAMVYYLSITGHDIAVKIKIHWRYMSYISHLIYIAGNVVDPAIRLFTDHVTIYIDISMHSPDNKSTMFCKVVFMTNKVEDLQPLLHYGNISLGFWKILLWWFRLRVADMSEIDKRYRSVF